MAEDLKHLIEAIHKDGVEKAEAEAARIIKEAKEKAHQLIRDAEAEAEKIRENARKEAESFSERSKKEIEQAGRDVLISVARGIERMLREVVGDTVKQSLTPDVLKEILITIGKSYFEENLGGKPSDLYLAEADANVLAGFVRERLRNLLQEGMTIHTSDQISHGFRIALKDQQFYHDFTDDAIMEEICNYLQPRIEQILRGILSGEEAEK